MSNRRTPVGLQSVAILNHDVFVCFRGKDVREGFKSHLVSALKSNQVKTINDEEFNRGATISTAIYQAIENSKIAITVLSRSFTESDWCMRELVKILECSKDRKGLLVLPVFYHVRTSDIRDLTGPFAGAPALWRKRFHMKKKKEIDAWKSALTEVASMTGWSAHRFRDEAALINDIVMYVRGALGRPPYNSDKEFENLLLMILAAIFFMWFVSR